MNQIQLDFVETLTARATIYQARVEHVERPQGVICEMVGTVSGGRRSSLGIFLIRPDGCYVEDERGLWVIPLGRADDQLV